MKQALYIAGGLLLPHRYAGVAGQYAVYWRLKDWLGRRRVQITALEISGQDKIRGVSTASVVLQDLVLGTLGRSWLAIPFIALAIGLDLTSYGAHTFLIRHGVHLPGVVPPFANVHIATVSQILVVVLGLYFAAFSIVVSSSLYAQVPDEVRELLLRERAVGTFMASLALGASYGIGVLALQAMGYTPRYGSVIITALIGIYCVVAFARYAPTLFRLFNPKYLLDPIREDLNRHIQGVTFADSRYLDSSLQDYRRRAVQRDLDALQHISQLPHSVPMTDAATVDFGLDVMAWYASRKDDIPSDSLWWPRRSVHHDWLTAGYEHLGPHVKSLTRMQPDREPDRLWVERILGRVIADGTRRVGESESESAFVEIMTRLASRARSAAYACCVQECLLIARSVFDALVGLAQQERDPQDERQYVVRLGAADAIGVTCANVVLGLYSRLDDLSVASIRGALDNIRVGNIQHNLWLPQEVRSIIERAQSAWQTERSVYGYTVTTAAFVALECEEAMSTAFLERVRRAVAPPRSLLIPLSERIRDPALKAVILQGAVDVSVRAKRLTEKLIERFDLDASNGVVASLLMECDSSFDEALTRFADSALQMEGNHDPAYPDFLGQAYHFVADRVFDCVITGDPNGITQLFPLLLSLGLRAITRIEDTIRENSPAWTNQIVEDLIELSAYAIVASGVFGKDLWTSMRAAWDTVVADKSPQLLRIFGNLVTLNRRRFRISPRSLLRHDWWLRFRTSLQQRHILPADRYGGPFLNIVQHHRNPVVAAFTYSGDIDEHDLFALFGVLYVRRRQRDASDAYAGLSGHFAELLKRVRQERRHKTRAISEDEDGL